MRSRRGKEEALGLGSACVLGASMKDETGWSGGGRGGPIRFERSLRLHV